MSAFTVARTPVAVRVNARTQVSRRNVSVKAANDAHIGFFNNQEHTGDPRNVQDLYTIDLGAQYEIVIGGWGNTQSVTRIADLWIAFFQACQQ